MGTTTEWLRVLEASVIYVLFVLIWETIKHESFSGALKSLRGWLFVAAAFGMAMVFKWRLFHGGVGIVFALLFLGMIGVGLLERRERNAGKVRSRSD